jgi:hypothetical protein
MKPCVHASDGDRALSDRVPGVRTVELKDQNPDLLHAMHGGFV